MIFVKTRIEFKRYTFNWKASDWILEKHESLFEDDNVACLSFMSNSWNDKKSVLDIVNYFRTLIRICSGCFRLVDRKHESKRVAGPYILRVQLTPRGRVQFQQKLHDYRIKAVVTLNNTRNKNRFAATTI